MTGNKIATQIKPQRESNFELLRLVSMLFIILHHFIIHGLKIAGYPIEDDITFLGVAFNSFFVIGVNTFILVSGYYGIKANYRKFFRLYIMCAFYLLLFNGFSFLRDGFHLKQLGFIFPFEYSQYWFIQSYLYLFLLSPFLNKIVNNCNKKEFTVLLLIGCILTFYFGYLWGGYTSGGGYNFINFMFLYLIGRFIALHTTNIKSGKKKWISMSIYILCSLIIVGFVEFIFHIGKQNLIWKIGYYYNSPLVITSSVAFFLFFRNLKIQSKIINWAAISVLAVYLVHENAFVSKYLYKYVASLGEQISNSFMLGVVLFSFAVGILVVCILFDKVRMVITNPIEKKLNKIPWESYFDKFVESVNRRIK